MRNIFYLLLILIFFFSTFITCSFQPWKIENLGKVEKVSKGQKGNLFISTSLLFASLQSSSKIEWTHSFPQNQGVNTFVDNNQYIYILSNNCKTLSLIKASNGNILWERNFELSTNKCNLELISINNNAFNDLLITFYDDINRSTYFYAISINGNTHWTKKISNFEYETKQMKKNIATIGGFTNTNTNKQLSIYSINLQNGNTQLINNIQPQLNCLLSIKNKLISLSNENFICIDSNLKGLNVFNGFEATPINFDDIFSGDKFTFSNIELLDISSENYIALKFEDKITILNIDDTISINNIFPIDPNSSIHPIIGSKHDLMIIQKNKLIANIYNPITNKTVDLNLNRFNMFGKIEKIFAFEETNFYNIYIVFEDHTFISIQTLTTLTTLSINRNTIEYSFLWQRNEALASISHTQIIDTPPNAEEIRDLAEELKEEAQASIFECFIFRISHEFNQLKVYILDLPNKLNKLINDLSDLNLNLNSLFSKKKKNQIVESDRFAFNKIIVAASTKANKLFGIDSNSGQILWSKFLETSNLCKTSGCNCQLQINTLQLISSPMHYPPEFVLIRTDSEKSEIIWFNPVDGQETKKSEIINFLVKKTIILPWLIDNEHPLLLIDENTKFMLLPETHEIVESFKKRQDHIFYYTKQGNNLINGFGIKDNKFEKTWSINFPNNTKIISISQPSPTERVSALSRVTKEGNTIIKYLNKNCISIVTLTTDEEISKTAELLLVDAVSGKILHHASWPNVLEPILNLRSENWAIIYFWNSVNSQYQISVFDMYEPFIDWEAKNHSSFDALNPIVASQAYFLNTYLNCLAVTMTSHGITQKNIIGSIPGGQLINLDKRLIDARRSQDPTKNDDGLKIYSAYLPIGLYSFLSKNQTLNGIEKIITVETALESTSFVLAIGIDLFATLSTPAGLFDTIDPSFNYALLMLSNLVLFIVIVALRSYSKRQELNHKWK
eukprot:TRINITY_DN1265_c2_g1_i2.p1 TRINITY_DN1265_c2_g1~~TRINITY_DN1265_c2_g1_i2.p1  ORF type:complete len:982 (-),score=305.78 TRINITY_DN1265_c2_g1_i2:1756-4632(-)